MGTLRIVACLLCFLCSLFVSVESVTAQAPARVDTPEALAQLLTRVEPTVPPEAVKAKIGGTVIADVIVSPKGTVSAVTILDGPFVLRAAAERALQQWTFKPFLLRGKPRMVQVILEVSFPDPVKEAENRIFDAHRIATYECRRQLEADAAKAGEACAEAVKKTAALPPDRVLERSHAASNHGQSLMAAGRPRDALAEIEKVEAIRAARVKGPDADLADVHHILALLHQQLGESAKADAEFTTAIEMYTAAFARTPSLADKYAPNLREALARHAVLKRAMGDSAASAALDARAARIAAPAEPPRPEPIAKTVRTVGDLQIVEPPTTRLTDDDLRQIRAALPPGGQKLWRVDLEVSLATASRPPVWGADAYLAPEVTSGTFRRGRFERLTTASPPGTKETTRVWRRVGGQFHYMQVASGATDPAAEPTVVQPAPNSPPPADDELMNVVKLIRERAAPKPTDRLLSDIQPWNITRIVVGSNGEWHLFLTNPLDINQMQGVRVRQKGGQWMVVELQALGIRSR